MTWTFDYTATFAIGSLAIILAGAFIYYLGMLLCDRAEIEFGKIGTSRRYDKIKYYKYGALLLDRCATSTLLLSVLSVYTISQIIFYLKIDLSCITDTNVYISILAFDLIVIIIQFYILFWNLKNIEKCDSEDIRYDQKLHQRCINQSCVSIVSLIAVGIVIIFIVFTVYSVITSGQNFSGNSLLHTILLMLLIFAFYVFLPVTLALLNMSNIAILHGCFAARLEMSKLNRVLKKSFVF